MFQSRRVNPGKKVNSSKKLSDERCKSTVRGYKNKNSKNIMLSSRSSMRVSRSTRRSSRSSARSSKSDRSLSGNAKQQPHNKSMKKSEVPQEALMKAQKEMALALSKTTEINSYLLQQLTKKEENLEENKLKQEFYLRDIHDIDEQEVEILSELAKLELERLHNIQVIKNMNEEVKHLKDKLETLQEKEQILKAELGEEAKLKGAAQNELIMLETILDKEKSEQQKDEIKMQITVEEMRRCLSKQSDAVRKDAALLQKLKIGNRDLQIKSHQLSTNFREKVNLYIHQKTDLQDDKKKMLRALVNRDCAGVFFSESQVGCEPYASRQQKSNVHFSKPIVKKPSPGVKTDVHCSEMKTRISDFESKLKSPRKMVTKDKVEIELSKNMNSSVLSSDEDNLIKPISRDDIKMDNDDDGDVSED